MHHVFLVLVVAVCAHAQGPMEIADHWNGGFKGTCTIHPTSDVNGWKLHLKFDKPLDKLEIWTARILETLNGGSEYVLGNQNYDAELHSGQDMKVEFVGRLSGDTPPSGTCTVGGQSGGTGSGGTGSVTAAPGPGTGTGTTAAPGSGTGTGTGSGSCQDDNSQCATWAGMGECTNNPDYMSTSCRLSCKQCTPSSGSTSSGGGSTGTGSSSSGSSAGCTGGGGSSMKHNYAQALGLSVLFYDAQRSGKLPSNNPIPWRSDSALGDGRDNGRDLTGGWYDAGDNVKFNLPMAYSTYVLAYGMLKFRDGYEKAGQLQQACDMIKWPLEYFLKCWNEGGQELYVQVGDGNADHAFWGRPEDMRMNRPSYKVTASAPGSDVAGDTASALASGYLLFKGACGDPSFAAKLLPAAKSVYTFAKAHKGIYSNSVPAAKQFYGSTGYKDELGVAAAWLYKATGDAGYLQDAKANDAAGTAWALSWDDKNIMLDLLLYEDTKDNAYKTDIEAFVKSYMPGGSVAQTGCGLAWRDQWGSNRYAGNAAFVALAAANLGLQPDAFKKWALTQLNYLLGDNKQHISFEIGFGNRYPKQPHHRGSSCAVGQNPCHPGGDNPNVLKGALVGGPDQGDNYQDSRGDYVKNEVACDYNAGFQSALAAVTHFAKNNCLPASPPSKC